MAEATRTATLAACYFLAPLALCAGLVVTGTFVTGYLATANLLIVVVVICGVFIAAFFSLIWKHLKALMLICSVSFFASCYWHFVGQSQMRRYLYMAEVLMTPHFDQKCVPPGGILFNGDKLHLCSTHDFNLGGWIDLIVKIDGSYPKDRLIEDINSGNINPAVRNKLNALGKWTFVFGGMNSVIGQPLLSDYYLVRYNMCGNASPYC